MSVLIPNASKIDSDEFGGLPSLFHICKDAHGILTRNLWVEKGLCNGNMGVVRDIIYQDGQCPPSLLLVVVVEFGDYTSPIFFPSYTKSVPVAPMMSQAYINGNDI